MNHTFRSTRTRRGVGTQTAANRRAAMRRGFTIVSMLMAIILLAVGLMSLASANAQTITMQTLAQNRTSAIAIARAYVEQVRTRDPWLVQTESPVNLNSDGQVATGGKFVRTLTVTTMRNNLIRLDIRVTYPRGTQPVQLTTSFFRGNGLSGAQ
jgi:type IV pilus assembly protein PilV